MAGNFSEWTVPKLREEAKKRHLKYHFIFLFCKKYQIKVHRIQTIFPNVNLLPYLLSLMVSAAGFFAKNMKKKILLHMLKFKK